MALETFNYPDGTNISAIPNAVVWGGDFETQSGVLKPLGNTSNARAVWPSKKDGVFEADIIVDSQSNGNLGIIFRGVDSDNYWIVRGTSSSGVHGLYKYVNGSGILVKNMTDPKKNSIHFRVEAYGESIKVYRDLELEVEVKDSTHREGNFAGFRMDNAQHGLQKITYQSTDVAPRQEYTFSGKALQATKLGILYNNHSLLSTAGATEEFWPSPFATDRIPNWPHTRYPMIIYSSTDHAEYVEGNTFVGGIFVRVWDSDVGPITDPNAWLEWNTISNRPEFDHISTKSEPIYQDPDWLQTETPTPVLQDGTIFMFYHTQGNDQNTRGATSTNGIDFTRDYNVVLSYDASVEQGDGHTGYLNVVPNPMGHLPYQFLANSTHGGGEIQRSPAQAIWGTNDFQSFERIALWGRYTGDLQDYVDTSHPEIEWVWVLWDVGSIKQEGNYWRMIVAMRPDVLGGGLDDYTRPLEILVDDNFNVVSEPNPFISIGGAGDYDELELHHLKEIPYTDTNGERYGVYKGLSADGTTVGGLCRLDEIDYDWTIIRTHQQRTVIHDLSSMGDFSFDTSVSQTDGRITQSLPFGGSASWQGASLILSDYDMVDIIFNRHSKDSSTEDIYGKVGLFDNIDSPTRAISLLWPDKFAPSVRMSYNVIDAANEVNDEFFTRKTVGLTGKGGLSNSYEDPRAAHTYGLRIIPAEGIAYVMDGVSRTTKILLRDLDLSQPLTIGSKFENASTDTDSSMSFDSVTVTTYSNGFGVVNNKPTATITGTDIDYAPNSTVPLVCEAEDLDGDTLTYFWEQLSNGAPTITIADPTSASTSFLAEAEDANIAVRCTVSDGTDSVIASATFYITEGSNAAPTVTINASKTTVNAGEQFTLTASASDTDGTIASYLWEQVDNGSDSVSISSTNSASTNVTAFSRSTQQTVKLRVTVTDDDGAVGSREVDIVVLPLEITPPTVVLGPNQSVESGQTVYLDATQSTAGSHPIASYEWTQTAGDTVTLVNSTTASPSFISPSENDAQTLTFSVVAIDTEGTRSTAKTVSIAVAAFNFDGSILELIDSVAFELITDGNLMIYPGRANREIIKLRPSSELGLVVDGEGCIDFEAAANTISKLEVIIYNTSEKARIDSESLAIVFEGSEAHCRFGDFQPKSAREPFDVAVVLYIEGDGRGVVVYSTSEALSTQGASPISAYVQSSLGV